jgi:hypothetical protein
LSPSWPHPVIAGVVQQIGKHLHESCGIDPEHGSRVRELHGQVRSGHVDADAVRFHRAIDQVLENGVRSL